MQSQAPMSRAMPNPAVKGTVCAEAHVAPYIVGLEIVSYLQ